MERASGAPRSQAGDFVKNSFIMEDAPPSDAIGVVRGRVLVADDEPSLARSLARVLAGAGPGRATKKYRIEHAVDRTN